MRTGLGRGRGRRRFGGLRLRRLMRRLRRPRREGEEAEAARRGAAPTPRGQLVPPPLGAVVGGIGCPSVLEFQSWRAIESFDLVPLTAQGLRLPPDGRLTAWVAPDGRVFLFRRRVGAPLWEMKGCLGSFPREKLDEAVAWLNSPAGAARLAELGR